MDASSDDTVVTAPEDAPPAGAATGTVAEASAASAFAGVAEVDAEVTTGASTEAPTEGTTEAPADTATETPTEASAQAASDAPTEATSETPAPRRKPRRASSAKRRSRTTVTFYLTESLRNRARATYRATSWGEHDNSWSEMLTKALLAEVERRELEHNGGRPFVASDEPLTPGRPIGF